MTDRTPPRVDAPSPAPPGQPGPLGRTELPPYLRHHLVSMDSRLASLEALNTATHELVGEASALTAEQEIFARAALAAATALGPAIAVAAEAPFDPNGFGSGRDTLVHLTEVFAELIRTGERPS